jgi:hypothetical protein
MLFGDGEVVAMAVKELPPFVWRTFAEGHVALSEEGSVAIQIAKDEEAAPLTTTGVELAEGKHYWEVELLSESAAGGVVDILISYTHWCRASTSASAGPTLIPQGAPGGEVCTDVWFMGAVDGPPWGNGKYGDDRAGGFEQGDRVGVIYRALAAASFGSLRMAQNGPGHAAGSVTGPVVAAVQMFNRKNSVRLLPNAQQPE